MLDGVVLLLIPVETSTASGIFGEKQIGTVTQRRTQIDAVDQNRSDGGAVASGMTVGNHGVLVKGDGGAELFIGESSMFIRQTQTELLPHSSTSPSLKKMKNTVGLLPI